MKKIVHNNAFVSDMIRICSSEIHEETARRGIRAFCRYFGGQIIYVPLAKREGGKAEEIRRVLSDEVGGGDAEKILARLMLSYGGVHLYVPLERCGFKREIALDIYARYHSSGDSGEDEIKIGELCREYNMSFTQVYRLWYAGRKAKLEKQNPGFDFGDEGD
jgi:Mor family transcriptional regulator